MDSQLYCSKQINASTLHSQNKEMSLISSILEMCFSKKKELSGYWSGVSSLTWLYSAPFQLGSQDKATAAESDTPARTVGLKYKRRTGTVAIFSPFLSQCLYLLTSTLAKLPVASPEDSYEGGSVMRSSPDVVILSEEDVVTVLHAAETTQVHTCPNIKNNDESSNKHVLHTDGRLHNLLFSKIANHPKLSVFLFVFQQLSHCVTQVK